MKKWLLIFCSVFCFFEGLAQQPDSTWIIKNLDINSVADDYWPFPLDTALLFTSTRKNTREEKLLENTEKVYYVVKADTSFGKIKKLGYSKANIDANSALVGVSNKYFFFYRSYFNDQGKLFMALRKQGTNIESLQEVPYINSDYDENSIAAKGDSLYFTSNRNGNYEIYFQTGKEKPIPVDILNSPFDEEGVWISPYGKELYFNSNREEKWFSIYRSDLIEGKWTAPQKLLYPFNMPDCDNIDYRKYNDSTIFWASNRSGGMGGYDLYQGIMPKKVIPPPDTTKLVVKDSIPKQNTLKRQIIPKTPIDSLVPREQLLIELKHLGLIPFRGEVQLGAYQMYLTSIELFKRRFVCVCNEHIRMDVFEIPGSTKPLRKFIIDHLYTELDSALVKQKEIVQKGCLPTIHESTPFIALLRADKKRYAIFWRKEEYDKKEVLWITLDGKEIWHSK